MTRTGRIVAGAVRHSRWRGRGTGQPEAPDRWQRPYFHPEMGATIATELAETDALLLGRRTYEEFAGFWPQVTGDPMADRMNAIPKLVASTTLDAVGWQNNSLLGPDPTAELQQRVDHGDNLTSPSWAGSRSPTSSSPACCSLPAR